MEHAKKFVLVDPRFAKPSIREKTLSSLDSEIGEILNSELSDDVKTQRYSNTLRRHRNYSNPPPPKLKPIEKLEPEILESVPQNQKYKAKRLIKRLKQRKDVDLTSDGELIYRQTKIPDSDISELIGDVLSTKSATKAPAGWEALSAALKASETPRELINNPSRWDFMQGTVKRQSSRDRRSTWFHY